VRDGGRPWKCFETSKEIARELENLIRHDGKRLPQEQIGDLIEAGVIDEGGRVLIGGGDKTKQRQQTAPKNGPGDGVSARKVAGA
jgi:hypothetical protein